MLKKNKFVFSFNPSARKKIDLSDLPSDIAFTKFNFSSLPTSKDCVMVGITKKKKKKIKILPNFVIFSLVFLFFIFKIALAIYVNTICDYL